MKTLKLTVLTALILSATGALAVDDETYNTYFDAAQNPVLTRAEVAGLNIARQYNKGVLNPVPGPNGSIMFSFGSGTPSIVCAPLQICDVTLQSGERINSINVGDPARWHIEPAVTGNGSYQQQHVIIKPLDVGLNTMMVVATDKRAYHIKLKSHKTAYMPLVTFSYPKNLPRDLRLFLKLKPWKKRKRRFRKPERTWITCSSILKLTDRRLGNPFASIPRIVKRSFNCPKRRRPMKCRRFWCLETTTAVMTKTIWKSSTIASTAIA